MLGKVLVCCSMQLQKRSLHAKNATSGYSLTLCSLLPGVACNDFGRQHLSCCRHLRHPWTVVMVMVVVVVLLLLLAASIASNIAFTRDTASQAQVCSVTTRSID